MIVPEPVRRCWARRCGKLGLFRLQGSALWDLVNALTSNRVKDQCEGHGCRYQERRACGYVEKHARTDCYIRLARLDEFVCYPQPWRSPRCLAHR
jgi:hypothetical protein